LGSSFFCNLGALSVNERSQHEQLSRRIARAVRTIRELESGYECDLDASDLTLIDLATWAELERRCCPFIDFGLEWFAERHMLTLRLSGGDGIKAFLRAEISALA
jgi:hypothetical protein